jgi:hypothetical protein
VKKTESLLSKNTKMDRKKENLKKGDPDFFNKSEEQGCAAWKGPVKTALSGSLKSKRKRS